MRSTSKELLTLANTPSPASKRPSRGGRLAGTTILRFAHAFESGGGTERYLDDLDSELLARNAMTIVRLHLTRGKSTSLVEEEMGQGRLVRIPLPIIPGEMDHANTDETQFRFRLKRAFRNLVIYNPLVWSAIGAKWTATLRLAHQSGQAIGAGQAAGEVFRAHTINLAMLHFFGGADAEEVIHAAQKFGVPFALLNHYANDRFLHLAIRKHATSANGLAGVNGLALPKYVRKRFVNLSDGIDTEFFQQSKARPLKNPPAQPVILLPARVVREKGQLDLVHAAATLRQAGIECCLAFAGRSDSTDFVSELRQTIARAGLIERVHFLGTLTVEELRDWYAASAIVALPTYHHEGLPRIVLEAQAMKVPVVAYATGGVADGVIEGKTGCLLRTGDKPGLANRLRELLCSPGLRATMGNNGRMAAETHFSLAALAERHEQFYARMISDFAAIGHR